MPAFTLYGAHGSTNTDRVRMTLAEGGFTDYELVQLHMGKGEHKSPEHIKRHPRGKVPAVTFADTGFTLYESRSICKYLARKYSIPLLPSEADLEALARFDQAQDTEMLYFATQAEIVAFEKFVKRFLGLPTDEAVAAKAVASLEAFFDIVEGQLSEREYMAGDKFTLVDIYYIPVIQRLFACGHEDLVTSRKAVSAWWSRCIKRPAIQQVLAAAKESAAKAGH